MKLNLDELSKAVASVAGLAGLAAEYAAMKSDMTNAQVAVDTLTASINAAMADPAGAAGLAAVAAALEAPELPLPSQLSGVPLPAPDDALANLK